MTTTSAACPSIESTHDVLAFLSNYARSGIATDSPLPTLVPVDTPGAIQSAHQLADWLVEQHFITTFQASRLLAGSPRLRVGKGGRYILCELLGEGGFGAVYRAKDSDCHGKWVALKLAHRTIDPMQLARCERESFILSQLDHESIVGCHDSGVEDDVPFFVMDLLRGVTLRQYINDKLTRNLAVPIGVAAKCILTIATGLDYAVRSFCVVHRDLKPENIFVTGPGFKILDFGLAKFAAETARLQDQKTPSNSHLGTPLYAAPEQVSDAKRADTRADIYSLGVMFYELLAGTVPFGGDNLLAVILEHEKRERFVPLHIRCPKLPKALVSIVHKMIERNAKDRFQSPSELIVALHAVQSTLEHLTVLPIEQTSETMVYDWSAAIARLNKHVGPRNC